MRIISLLRWGICALFLALALCVTASNVHAAGNGISAPTNQSRVYGIVAIRGVADAPDFAAWQLDILLGGDENAPVMISRRKTSASVDDVLAKLDTRTVPDGQHRLRLRVIKTNGQYDEFFVTFTIDNTSAPPAPPPKGSANAPAGKSTKVAAILPTPLNQILSPADNASVSGLVLISGIADSPDFQSWKLDLLFDGKEDQVLTIAAGRARVPTEDNMTQLDTTLLPNGSHILRLRVSTNAGTFTESTRRLVIQNQVPEKPAAPLCPQNRLEALPPVSQAIIMSLFKAYVSHIKSPCNL